MIEKLGQIENIKNNSHGQKHFISKEELEYEFFRSSGPGGQNVNKISSGVRIRWNIDKSRVLTEEQKFRIKTALKNRITEKNELLIENEDTRSQLQNKKNAYSRLIELIGTALRITPKRIPAKIPKKAIMERLSEKKKTSQKKQKRRISEERFADF